MRNFALALPKLARPAFAFCSTSIRESLIKSSLVHVHKYGWSDNAIIAGCSQLGLSPASHRIIRPYDLIAHCMARWNASALRKLDDTDFDGQRGIRNRIQHAIKLRLEEENEYLEVWNQAMAIGAHPDNLPTTKDLLWHYSDEVWVRCGDTSTDYNYYTKRILFNTAYAATQLHMLTDRSEGRKQTWQFLSRRLDDILWVGKGVNDLKVVGGAAMEGLTNVLSALVVGVRGEAAARDGGMASEFEKYEKFGQEGTRAEGQGNGEKKATVDSKSQ